MYRLPLLGVFLTGALMLVLFFLGLNLKSPLKTTDPEFIHKQPAQIKCVDFLTQSDAQLFFNHHTADFQHLDKDQDGQVCESLRT